MMVAKLAPAPNYFAEKLAPCPPHPPKGKRTPLDNTAQLRNCGCGNDRPKPAEILKKRAKSKALTKAFITRMAEIENSRLNNAYWNTYYCASQAVKMGDKVKVKWCKNRWCIACNRILMAKMLAGYSEPLNALNDPQLLTLTCGKRVTKERLPYQMHRMKQVFRRIFDRLRKQGIKPNGVRKFECTHNADGYHPHFHCIVEGREMAEIIKAEWLKEWPFASKRGQDIKAAREGTLMEIFKYTFKILPKKGEQVNYTAMDVIFAAQRDKRSFQPFGNVRKVAENVKEEIEELTSEQIEGITAEDGIFVWIDKQFDWVNLETGEVLADYKPSRRDKKMIKQLNSGEYA